MELQRVYLDATNQVVEFVKRGTWERRTQYRNPSRESLQRLSAAIRDGVSKGRFDLTAYCWGWCAVEWITEGL